jgi:hypothetical protein
MIAKLIVACVALVAASAQAQTIYRTVSPDGKVTYSDTPPLNDGSQKVVEAKDYSPDQLGATNTAGPAGHPGNSIDPSCTPDVKKYCSKTNDPSKTFDCLLDHQNDVTDACYTALKRQVKSGQKDSPAADKSAANGTASKGAGVPGGNCKQDVRQFCSAVKPGGGRIMDCLLDHQKSISDGCYTVLAKQLKNSGN